MVHVPVADWEKSRRFAGVFHFLDQIQLMLFLFLPFWNWSLMPKLVHSKALAWVYRAQIQRAVADKGIPSLLVLQYVTGVVVCINAAFLIHVAWEIKVGKAINKWILRFGRILLVAVSQIFSLSLMALYLAMSACDWRGTRGPPSHYLYFPQDKCFGGNAVHALIGGIFFVVHVIVSLIAAGRYLDTNITGGTPLLVYGASWIVQSKAARILLVIITHLMIGYRPQLAAFLVLALGAWFLQLHWTYLPFGSVVENGLGFGVATSFLYCAVILFIKESVATSLPQDKATTAVLAGFAPAFLLGVAIYVVRLWGLKTRFRALWTLLAAEPDLTEDQALDTFLFRSPYEPAQILRTLFVSRHRGVSEEMTEVLDFMGRMALVQYDKEAVVHLAFATYRAFHLKDGPGGHNRAEGGARVCKNVIERFEVYVALCRLKKSNDEGDQAADLSSYVDYSNTFKAVTRFHQRTLEANRQFWMHVLRSEVKLTSLARLVKRLELLKERSDAQYRQAIEAYPRSVALLRSYARFVEEVHLDQATAARYLTEAEKLEEKITTMHRESATDEAGAESIFDAALTDLDGSSQSAIMIDTAGTIVYVNKALCDMFGWRQSELTGKPISTLMPLPFSKEHSQYMKSYLTTGKPSILDNKREVIALHKERWVFSPNLLVKKVMSQGVQYFMGCFTPIPSVSLCVLCLSCLSFLESSLTKRLL